MSYNYWNNFVENWGVLPQVEYINPNPIAPFHSILNWINPNLSPLMNSDQLADYSLKYNKVEQSDVYDLMIFNKTGLCLYHHDLSKSKREGDLKGLVNIENTEKKLIEK